MIPKNRCFELENWRANLLQMLPFREKRIHGTFRRMYSSGIWKLDGVCPSKPERFLWGFQSRYVTYSKSLSIPWQQIKNRSPSDKNFLKKSENKKIEKVQNFRKCRFQIFQNFKISKISKISEKSIFRFLRFSKFSKFWKIWNQHFRKFWAFFDFYFSDIFRFLEFFSRNFCRMDF